MTKRARALGTSVATGTSLRNRGAGLMRRVPAASLISKLVGAVRARWPGAVDATLAGAQRTTRAVQGMSDSDMRTVSAGSVGLGAGLFIGGAPRLVAAAGIAPAIVMGAAVLARPDRRDAAMLKAEELVATVTRETGTLDNDGGRTVTPPDRG